MWRPLVYLQDVALLDGGVLQLAGLLLQALGRPADGQAGHYLLWQPEGALALLQRLHLLLEALHLHQHTLREQRKTGVVGEERRGGRDVFTDAVCVCVCVYLSVCELLSEAEPGQVWRRERDLSLV